MNDHRLSTIICIVHACLVVVVGGVSYFFADSPSILVSVVLASMGIYYFVIQIILKPLHELLVHSKQALNAGKNWNDVEVKGFFEVNRLCLNISTLFSTQNRILEQATFYINDMYCKFKASADRDSKAVSDLIAQRDEIHTLASASIQMSASTREIDENVEELANTTHHSSEYTEQGYKIVLETKDGINSFSFAMHEASQMIEELTRYVADISKVSSSIRDISDQTNLLALNAAIEAARAGEQGRGFAVVADEVRALSLRTQASTSDIDKTINILQHSAHQAMKFIKNNTEQASNLIDKSAEASNSLNEINIAMHQISEKAVQIAKAVSNQATVSEDVARNIEKINVFASGLVEVASDSVDEFSEWTDNAFVMLRMLHQDSKE